MCGAKDWIKWAAKASPVEVAVVAALVLACVSALVDFWQFMKG
jgi:hypothetical protein